MAFSSDKGVLIWPIRLSIKAENNLGTGGRGTQKMRKKFVPKKCPRRPVPDPQPPTPASNPSLLCFPRYKDLQNRYHLHRQDLVASKNEITREAPIFVNH